MKLLENTLFDSVSSYLICNASDFLLDVRLETYSCKMITTDKKVWKKNSNIGNELQPLSPPQNFFMTSLSVSPLSTLCANNRLRHLSEPSCSGSDNDAEETGILVEAVSRRTLFDIVALLNLSYPDYDFSQTKSASFSIIPYLVFILILIKLFKDCVQNVDAKFSATVSNYGRVREEMWKVINEEIKIADCVIYSYIPGYNGDPFTEDGCIWSFNYLFYNKMLKRFLFFACRALCTQNLDVSSEQLWGLASTKNDEEEQDNIYYYET